MQSDGGEYYPFGLSDLQCVGKVVENMKFLLFIALLQFTAPMATGVRGHSCAIKSNSVNNACGDSVSCVVNFTSTTGNELAASDKIVSSTVLFQ